MTKSAHARVVARVRSVLGAFTLPLIGVLLLLLLYETIKDGILVPLLDTLVDSKRKMRIRNVTFPIGFLVSRLMLLLLMCCIVFLAILLGTMSTHWEPSARSMEHQFSGLHGHIGKITAAMHTS